ncbi:MAG: hypothetical protein KGR26_07725 [Cyanobacteria bacterium REEB65]|nr:hypothetical protein [Cyanobacteria bacterium REEB65]
MNIAARVSNLLFAEKLLAAASLRGDRVVVVGSCLEQPVDLLVLDLSEPGWEALASQARDLHVRVLGFGPHVRSELFAAARQLGVQRSVANSKFAEATSELLGEFC